MHFAIGTTNKPKSTAIEHVLATSPYTSGATFSNHRVESWVPDMPTTLEELRTWAKNRAVYTRREKPDADYFVGMEWGVYQDYEWEEYWLAGVVYIEDWDGIGNFWYSCHLKMPLAVVLWLFDGQKKDIEQVVEILYGEESVGDKEGTFWLFSDWLLPRSDSFVQATKAALVPHFSKFYK